MFFDRIMQAELAVFADELVTPRAGIDVFVLQGEIKVFGQRFVVFPFHYRQLIEAYGFVAGIVDRQGVSAFGTFRQLQFVASVAEEFRHKAECSLTVQFAVYRQRVETGFYRSWRCNG